MSTQLSRMFCRIAEKLGLMSATVVATVDYEVEWPFADDQDDDDVVDLGCYTETITFYCLEYPSGRRDFKVHQYGKCAELDYFDVYMRDVLLWMYGGQLPPEAVRTNKTAEVLSFKMIKGGEKQVPPQPTE